MIKGYLEVEEDMDDCDVLALLVDGDERTGALGDEGGRRGAV
jgi:hypothetical protein